MASMHTVLCGLNHTKEYYGEGTIHRRTRIETTVELFFRTLTGNILTSPTISQYASYISGLQSVGGYGNFSIGTISFTNSRITSSSFPTSVEFGENAVADGKAIVTVETLQNGDVSGVSGTYLSGIASTGINDANIVSLTESFSASESASGEYSFNHDVSIEMTDTTTDSQTTAKTIALAIFNSNPPFGIHFRPNVLSTANRGKDLFSEKIEEIHNRYTFSRKYAEKPGICGTGWCALVDYTYAFGASGEITVTEKANITGQNWAAALAGYNYLLPGAHGRCNVVYSRGSNGWTTHSGQSTTAGLPGSLHVQSVDLSQSANTAAFNITYETTFTNDIQMSTLYTITRNIQYTADADNIITGTENATLTAYVKKLSGVNMLQAMFAEWAGAAGRVNASKPNEPHQNPFVLIDESFDYSQHGKNANYTRTFSTDPSFQGCPTGFNKAKVTFDDQIPREIANEYQIIRNNTLVHTPGQMTPGSRTVSFDGQLARIPPAAGHPLDFAGLQAWWNIQRPRAVIGVGARLKAALLNVLIDNALPFPVPYAAWNANGTDLYLTDISYTIDSTGHVTGTATATFHPQFINFGP